MYPFTSANLSETCPGDQYPSVFLHGLIFEGRSIFLIITYDVGSYSTALWAADGDIPQHLANHVANYIKGQALSAPSSRLQIQFKGNDFDLGLTQFLQHLAKAVND